MILKREPDTKTEDTRADDTMAVLSKKGVHEGLRYEGGSNRPKLFFNHFSYYYLNFQSIVTLLILKNTLGYRVFQTSEIRLSFFLLREKRPKVTKTDESPA